MVTKNQQAKFEIVLRQEIFDHLIYPLYLKLDSETIIHLFRKLHIISTIDYKISLEDWIQHSTNYLNGFTEKEARILFSTYKIYSQDFEMASLSNQEKLKKYVDLRYFGLYFSLQLYIQQTKENYIDTLDKNAYGSNPYSSNPYSSPRLSRNPLMVSNSNISEVQPMLQFVKNNIKVFLRLIASDIHNTETQLNSSEFNTLKFFFRIIPKDEGNKDLYLNSQLNLSSKMIFSNVAPFFMNFSPTTKVNIERISEWFHTIISTCVSKQDEMTVILKNLSKCFTVKEDIGGKNLKILNCEDSQIYINSAVSSLKIANCIGCVIFVAATTKITSIDRCENCQICVCSVFLRINNITESKIALYTTSEPILMGDNRGVILMPHNVVYDEYQSILRTARIPFNYSYSKLFNSPICMNCKPDCYEVLQPKDFFLMRTPFKDDSKDMILTPKEYSSVILQRNEYLLNLQKMIVDSELQEDQQKALHVAIQGYFRDWLVSSGNIKSILEVIKNIDLSQ